MVKLRIPLKNIDFLINFINCFLWKSGSFQLPVFWQSANVENRKVEKYK